MTIPAFMKHGFRRNGPSHVNCQRCGKRVSSNALAWRSHWRNCPERLRRDHVSVEGAAERLACHPETIRRRIRAGTLAARKFGGGQTSPWRVLVDDAGQPITTEVGDAEGRTD